MSVSSPSRPSSPYSMPEPSRRAGSRRGPVAVKWLVAFCLLGVSAWVAYGFVPISSVDLYRGVLTVPVKRGDLLITVVEDGNLESAKNLDLKCQVPGSQTILEIVTDGSHVKQGDLLVRLDSSMLEDAILSQQIVQARSEAAKITAEKTFAAAKISVEEYREGTFVQAVEQLQATITMAKQNMSSAENMLFHSKRMYSFGYVSELDVESKEFALEQARLNLGVAELKKDVLQKFTRAKMLEDLISKRDSAEALMKSQQAAAQQESSKLKRLEDNLDKCVIRAPYDGMVVYANDMSGGRRGRDQGGPKIELGAQVRQFQAILRMPDIKHMQVKVLVHETKVDQLRRGQRARIVVQDRDFQGEVVSIANQPEAASRQSENVKEYATIVAMDGEPEGLKPGMTADLEILVEQKKGVLAVPVQCVVDTRRKHRAWVKMSTGIEPRELVLGATDDISVEIVDGLKEGEQVLLNPRAVMGPEETVEPADAEKTLEQAKPDKAKPEKATPEKGEAGQRSGPPGERRADGGGPAGDQRAQRGDNQSGSAGDRQNGAGPRDATAPDESAGEARGGRPGGGQGRPGGGRRRLNFKELDKNGDGKVSIDEMPEDRRERFGRMDANGDGFIDQEEQKAMEDRMRQAQQQGGWGGGAPPGAQ